MGLSNTNKEPTSAEDQKKQIEEQKQHIEDQRQRAKDQARVIAEQKAQVARMIHINEDEGDDTAEHVGISLKNHKPKSKL